MPSTCASVCLRFLFSNLELTMTFLNNTTKCAHYNENIEFVIISCRINPELTIDWAIHSSIVFSFNGQSLEVSCV
ncbi:hypothetical protein Vspart_03050 [Vibrio spartinae]|uniref:Uncharacterized protein n=1 Tax=Vibrio spartinae TaxID=1918945 RepID=A0ABX6R2F2_9VIBR|nr:hypothetical protein Vspart_03050 [Vibrio spartinae]